MCRPHPGKGDLEERDQDRHGAVHLHQLDHNGVSAWVKEESCDCLSVSLQGLHDRVQKVWVGGKHIQEMLEGNGKIRL